MTIEQIESNIRQLVENVSEQTFPFELLTAYGLPKAAITRLRNGTYNLVKQEQETLWSEGIPPIEILWKKKLYFKHVVGDDLHAFIDNTRKAPKIVKNDPRFVIATDYQTFLAYDTKTDDTLDIAFGDLLRSFEFFLPWAGMEKVQPAIDNPADVKAAEKMARLYDLIRQDNPDDFRDPSSLHNLNVFLSRLLFCYFAEATEIFTLKLFTNSIASHTQADGSDLHSYLDELFAVLNVEERSTTPAYLKHFPYVNGGLFEPKINAPRFTPRSRKMLVECGRDLNWADINPDIFGSMIQAVVHPAKRSGMGMHYTSVVNIMKVIEPLFLTSLREEAVKSKDDPKKLDSLIQRLRSIRVFDPACGSGNFLIIAYKELRKLEIDIFQRLQEVSPQKSLPLSRMTLGQFFGIEYDDFAHEVAILSLWLAEHQMNVAFKQTFGRSRPSLPLRESGRIVRANALRKDWNEVCPRSATVETYLIGNPPYYGSYLQTKSQKTDLDIVFRGETNYKNLDYIAGWFYKGIEYIRDSPASLAFVTTNSICQGEQVEMLWPHVFAAGLEIGFAHRSFKWQNSAKSNAAVYCVIISLRKSTAAEKFYFTDITRNLVANINPYLVPSINNTILHKRRKPISALPPMTYGNKPADGGGLSLDDNECKQLLSDYPAARPLLKRLYGASEFTSGAVRWCLWIDDAQLKEAVEVPPIRKRLCRVLRFRVKSDKGPTRNLARTPYRFAEIRHQELNSIIVPRHGSDRRRYMPFGFMQPDVIISDAAQVIYTETTYVFGVISSRMHLLWIKASCGKLKEDPRYSSALGYNNFPLPRLPQRMVKAVENAVLNLLDARERFPEMTIDELYDPDLMPEQLLEAHVDLDEAVERCYRSKPFLNDEERLEHLFNLYEQMLSAAATLTEN